MSGNAEEIALNHATKHFEIHAAQRLTAFNFFIVISGAILAAIAACIQKPEELAWPGITLGGLLAALSFIFWKLDRRTKFLIKHSESAIKKYEKEKLDPDFRVFTNEQEETNSDRNKNRYLNRMFSYSEAFGFLFVLSGLLGIIGAAILLISPHSFSPQNLKAQETVNSGSDPVGEESKGSAQDQLAEESKTPLPTGPKISTKQTSTDGDLDVERRQSGS